MLALPSGPGEQVLPGLRVHDALVHMHGAAGLAAHRLGHESGVDVVAQRHLAHRALEQEHLVREMQRVAMQEVDLHLRRTFLVDQRVEVHLLQIAEIVHFLE